MAEEAWPARCRQLLTVLAAAVHSRCLGKSSATSGVENYSLLSLRSKGYLKAAAMRQLISKTSEFRAEEYKAFEAQSVAKLQTRMAGMYDNPVKEMRFIRCSWP